MKKMKRLWMCFVFVLALSAAVHAQKLDPQTQVAWPANCTGPAHFYNFITNQCVTAAMVDSSGHVASPVPPNMVTWPASCSTGVYVPATNTCVPTGTAANPAPPVGSGQMNAGGVFSAIPGLMADPTNGFVTAGGLTYARGAQTGSGGNGILNSAASGTNVMADPSYVIKATANMSLGSTTITVSNVTGGTIVPGMYTSGNTSNNCTVVSVAGNSVVLSGPPLSTNPAATVYFFENRYRIYMSQFPPLVQNYTFVDAKLGWRDDLKFNAGQNPITNGEDYNVEGCFTTLRNAWQGGGGSNETCHTTQAWFAAPSSNYGSPWGVTAAEHVVDVVPQKGIGELQSYVHDKTGIGDGPTSYLYYADYLGSVAPSDEGQGGPFIGGGEATTTTSGTVINSTGAGETLLSFSCTADCSSAPGVNSGGPGDGRYWVDMTGGTSLNMVNKTSPAGQIPGLVLTDTAVPVSTFWGTLNATVQTPPPPPNSNGVPFSSGTTAMTFTVNSGTINIPYALASVAAASGGTTTYTGTPNAYFASACATPGTTTFTVSGFANGANNGSFTCASATATTLVLNNGGGIAETRSATATFAAANTGSPQVGDLVCFSWPWHEQAKISAVNSGTFPGPWSITVPLRMPHSGTSWMFSGGACGSYIDFPGNDVAQNVTSQGPSIKLHYPSDIIGSISPTTLVYVWFNSASENSGAPGPAPFGLPTLSVPGTATNVGGLVTFSNIGPWAGSIPSSYWNFFNQPVLSIWGAADPAYNGTCTNSGYGGIGGASIGTNPILSCYQASSLNHAATTVQAIAGGSSPFTPAVLWKGAEGLDILDYVDANCQALGQPEHAPCYDNKNIQLEPNNAAWANGDSIEESHHYSGQLKAGKQQEADYSPYSAQLGPGQWIYNAWGAGVCCGQYGNPAFNRAMVTYTNLNAPAVYARHGGGASPIGGINLESQSSGAGEGYNYGLNMQYAPEPSGSSVVHIGCPSAPTTAGAQNCGGDLNYVFNLFAMDGYGSIGNTISYAPYFNELRIGNQNPVVWVGDMNGLTMRDMLVFAPMAQPTITVTPSNTGGQLAGGTFSLTAATSGGATTTYTGTGLTGLCVLPLAAPSSNTVNITGFSNAGNNGTFSCNATSTATTLVLNNSGGVNEPVATGTAAYAYCYTITAHNTAGSTATTTEVCKPLTTAGNTGSMNLSWPRTSGATQYYPCGRTSGSEQRLPVMVGVDSVSTVDTGGYAPFVGCYTGGNGTVQGGGVDQASQVGFNSSGGTGNAEAVVKAPASMAANTTITLPSVTGTLAVVIYTGTTSMPTTAVAAGGCSGVGTNTPASTPNVLQTDSIKWSWQAAPGTITGNLILNPFVTNGGMGFIYCNPGAASQTPPAATLSWQVTR